MSKYGLLLISGGRKQEGGPKNSIELKTFLTVIWVNADICYWYL